MKIGILRSLRENVCLQAAFWINLSVMAVQLYFALALHFNWPKFKIIENEYVDISNFVFMAPLIATLLCFLSLFEFLIKKCFIKKQRIIKEPKTKLLKLSDKIYSVIFLIMTFFGLLAIYIFIAILHHLFPN